MTDQPIGVKTWSAAEIAEIKRRLKWSDAIAFAYICSIERDNSTLQRNLMTAVNKIHKMSVS